MKRIYTDMAIIDVAADGLVLREVLSGMSPQDVQAKTEAALTIAADWRKIDVPKTCNGIQLLQ